MDELIDKIIDKKELRGINKNIIKNIIIEYKKQNLKSYLALEKQITNTIEINTKSKEFKLLKKYVRQKLRILHGVFQKNKQSKAKQEKYLEKKDFNFNSKDTQTFLKSHRSTKERLEHFKTLYNTIEQNIGKINSIADLGCGLNPLSYTLLKDLKEVYLADISTDEVQFLDKYIKNNKFKGCAQTLDLTNNDTQEIIRKNTKNKDVTFLFKVLDGLEYIKRGASKELIKNINSKNIIISFSNKSISGKNQITSQRQWFKKIIEEEINQGAQVIEKTLGHEEYYIMMRK
ncbi:MAG: hypothetical protein ACLFN8_03080 [Candidatus Woesearchaeota archaeon]